MTTSSATHVMKRICSVFVAAVFAMALVPAAVFAQPANEAGQGQAIQETQPAPDADSGLVAQDINIAQGQVGTCSWRIESTGRLVIEPMGGNETGDLGDIHYDFRGGVGNAIPSNAPWYSTRDRITSAYIASGVRADMTMTGLFYDCKNLKSADISRLDTSRTRNIGGMFDGCTSLERYTMPNLNFNNVTDMKCMFYGCTSLKSLDLRYIDTSNVVIMDRMFYGCSALTSINFSGFKTKSVKQMADMFNGCSSLASVDVSGFDTSNVNEMWNMFRGCSSLTALDLSNFKTDCLTTMRDMFYGCTSIKSIDLSSFRVSTGTDRGSSLFYGCPALERVSFGKGWTFAGAGNLRTSLPTGDWLSTTANQTFTARQIADDRNNIADTYVKYRPSSIAPTITMGNGLVWARGSLGGAAFRSTAEYADFVRVQIDGGVLDRVYYDVREGSTIVTLKPEYVTTLINGEHSIDIVSATGTASAKFSVTGEGGNPTILDPTPMYRLYNPNSGEHFYTASTVERDATIAAGWNDEGIGWTAPAAGDPVYRLYNQYGGEHHYTTSKVERDSLIEAGWTDEGVGWHSGGAVRLDRQYNPNAYANNHNYTSSALEKENLLSLGWQDEGVAWYGVK